MESLENMNLKKQSIAVDAQVMSRDEHELNLKRTTIQQLWSLLVKEIASFSFKTAKWNLKNFPR